MIDKVHEPVLNRIAEVEERLTERLNRIETQTTATNGRVSRIELAREREAGYAQALRDSFHDRSSWRIPLLSGSVVAVVGVAATLIAGHL